MPPRILTQSQQRGLAFQAQGSSPDGALTLKPYSLDDTLVFAASTTTYNLFGSTQGQSSKWLTNMMNAGAMPGGQNMMVFGTSLGLDVSSLTQAKITAALNQFYGLMRTSVWTFARNNEDFSFKIRGSKFLPAISYIAEYATPTLAAQHVGDFSRSSMQYKLFAPVVVGQNTGFTYTVELEKAPTDDLIGLPLQVFLDGGLTQKQNA